MLQLKPGVTVEKLQAFIGPNADKIIRRGTRQVSWCWPGLFFPSLWLAYRKAYLAAFLVFFVECVASAWGIYLMLGTPEFGYNHPWALATLIRIIVALFGLNYYVHLAINRLAKIEADTTDIASRDSAYHAKGRTSVAGMLLFLIASSAVGTVVYSRGVQALSDTSNAVIQTTFENASIENAANGMNGPQTPSNQTSS